MHRYWRLVRSVRVGRRVIQQTVAHLGELDEHGRVEARAFARTLIGAPEQAQLFDDGSAHLTVPVRLKGVRVERMTSTMCSLMPTCSADHSALLRFGLFCLLARIAWVWPSTQKPVKKLMPSTWMPWSRIRRAASMESSPPEIRATALRSAVMAAGPGIGRPV